LFSINLLFNKVSNANLQITYSNPVASGVAISANNLEIQFGKSSCRVTTVTATVINCVLPTLNNKAIIIAGKRFLAIYLIRQSFT
jgi:hypothetical protein